MKKFKRICIVLLVLVSLYFMPFIVVNVKDTEGHVYKAPFLSAFVSKDKEKITFQSIRSGYALDKDAENAFYSYGENACYGKTYFYDAGNNISYYKHSTSSAFPSKLEYYYEEGNACDGWDTDKEVAFAYGDIKDVDENMTVSEAVEKNYFVIEDTKAVNKSTYNDFSRLVKQGVFSYLRTVIYENQKIVKIIDIQLLENAKFRVIERDANSTTEKEYVRFSDTEKEDASKDVCVYEKNYKDAEPILLFTVQ